MPRHRRRDLLAVRGHPEKPTEEIRLFAISSRRIDPDDALVSTDTIVQ
jgi:hypothetical protein